MKKKKSKAALLNVALLHDIWEIWIRDKISTKTKTAKHWSISTLQQMRPKQYCFQTNLIEPCHLGKISLNFDIPSPTKFVNFFSFFENLATNIKEQTISDKAFWETSSFIKNAASKLLRIWKRPYNYFIFERTRSSIMSNLQHDYSIPRDPSWKWTRGTHIKQSRLWFKSERNSLRYLQIQSPP